MGAAGADRPAVGWGCSGHGVIMGNWIPAPRAACTAPSAALDLSWVVLICFLLNRLVGQGGTGVSSEGSEGSRTGKQWPQVPDHHSGPRSPFVL